MAKEYGDMRDLLDKVVRHYGRQVSDSAVIAAAGCTKMKEAAN